MKKKIVSAVFVGLLMLSVLLSVVTVPAMNSGLVAYYNFDEGSGTIAKDSSGNGNDGTIHGATYVDGNSSSEHSYFRSYL
jgi:hypothetical protein